MALTYYLTIDGVAGNSTTEDHKGAFQITDFSFDISNLIDIGSAGGGAGKSKPTFTPLTIDLGLTSGLTALLKDAITGKRLDAIELQGVVNSKDKLSTVYDLKLGDVFITDIKDASTGQDQLTFTYEQFSLTTKAQKADGTLGSPTTVSWNLLTNSQDVEIASPAVSGTPTGGDAQTYYLTIDGVAGNSTTEDHKGAFQITDFKFDISSLIDIGSAGGGGGAGKSKPTFSPLTVDLDLTSGLTDLLKDAITGKHLDAIELQGVVNSKDKLSTVYDLKLGDVFITDIKDASTGQDQLTFTYQQFSLTTKAQKADGTLGSPTTVSWNLLTNKQDVDIASPDIPGTPTGGAAQTYYLTIDGVAGNSTTEDHKGAFQITDFSFDISNLIDIGSAGGGAGKSKPTFTPLTIDLGLTSGLTALLKDAITGKRLDAIELQGVVNSKDKLSTVYDLKLGDVFITDIKDASTGQDQLTFTYEQFSLTTKAQKADGTLGSPTTVSWNLLTNSQDVEIASPAVSGTPTGGDAQTYYLTIDGVAGNSTTEDHKGAFQITDFKFDISSLIDIGSAGGGGGAGKSKPTFSPLTVDLDLTSGLTDLLKDAITGKHLDAIELQGVVNSKDKLSTVYDLKLGDVFITDIKDASTGQDQLTFTYQQFSLTTKAQKADGTLGSPTTVSWNLLTNKQDVDIASPDIPGTPTGGAAQTYYLTIDGVVGNSTTEDHKGAFQITDFSFDISNLIDIGSAGGGAGKSKPTFTPLTIDLGLTSGLTALLKDAITGKRLDAIELQGVVNSKDKLSTVYDLKLGDVFITDIKDASTGQDQLTFTYEQFSLTTKAQKADGTLGSPTTVSWNLLTNSQDVEIASPAVSGTPTGGDAQTYYLTIDGVAGNSTTEDHKGAFQITDFKFDISSLIDIGSAGGGGGAGKSKPTFSPLTIEADVLNGLTALLKDDITGHQIRSIELQGVVNSKDKLSTVYDLKLGNVFVTDIKDTSTGQDQLTFAYQQFSLTTKAQKADGTLSSPTTVSWNLLTNKQDVDIPSPVLTPDNPPVAGGDTVLATTGVGGVASGNVLANDTDLDGDTLTATAFDGDLAHGHLTLVANGDFTYTVAGLNGPTGSHLHDLFNYEVSDGRGGTATANLDITLNRAPTATADATAATTGIGGTAYGNVLANDSDPDGDALTVTTANIAGSHGTLTQNADGSFSYIVTDLTGPTGSHLHDIFSYSEADGFGGAGSASLDILLNRAPIAVGDATAATTGIGGTASGNVLLNDSDPDGDALAVTLFSGPTVHGTLTLNADGSFSYAATDLTGPTGSHLHDIFTYSEFDGQGGSTTASLDITLNRAPIALNDLVGVQNRLKGNVLINDSDPDGDGLAVTAIKGGTVGQALAGSFGTLVLSSNGDYTYQANKVVPAQFAQDIFTFTVSDGHGGSVQSSIALSIVPSGQAFVAGLPGQTIAPGNGKNIMDGSLGTQQLIGGTSADTLLGGPGDVLTGGSGADLFVFHGAFGANEITDFLNPDKFQLDRSIFGSAADVLAFYAKNDGAGNTLITDPHNAANTVKLDNVSVNQLLTSNFTLV